MNWFELVVGILKGHISRASAVCLAVLGILYALQDFIDLKNYPHLFGGLQLFFLGAVLYGIAWGQKHATDMMAQSEAEKRVHDPNLPSESTVPAIQMAIEKLAPVAGAPPKRASTEVKTS